MCRAQFSEPPKNCKELNRRDENSWNDGRREILILKKEGGREGRKEGRKERKKEKRTFVKRV